MPDAKHHERQVAPPAAPANLARARHLARIVLPLAIVMSLAGGAHAQFNDYTRAPIRDPNRYIRE
ncbi:MAG: hypothetical protein WDZ48_02640 [Pirellulales bacterium]